MTVLTRELEALGLEAGSISYRDARALWLEYRRARGLKSATAMLTPPNAQPKTGKNTIPTYVLHLAPSVASGLNTCAFSTSGCAAACLNTSGRGRFSDVQRGRELKTTFLGEHPRAMLAILEHEISAAVARHNGRVLIRLNGTSDIRWELVAPWLFDIPGAEYYDYTKYPRRPHVPDNYAIAYSASERDSDAQLIKRAAHYGHVAIVVDIANNPRAQEPVPVTFLGLAACDGDTSDDWRDREAMVLLRAKGKAIGDTSGFVRKASA